MVPLLLSDISYSINKIQSLLEIMKGEGTSNVMFVHDLPVRPFRQLLVQVSKFFPFEWRHATAARHASFAGKFRHKSRLPSYAP
jgi:hypothetical protein